jgi:hypothetical protein
MVSALIDIIKVVIVVKILYSVARFFFVRKSYSKGRKGKSIAGKVGTLLFNKTHYLLDDMLKKQREKRADKIIQQPANVIPIKKGKIAKRHKITEAK